MRTIVYAYSDAFGGAETARTSTRDMDDHDTPLVTNSHNSYLEKLRSEIAERDVSTIADHETG
ncbi:hypothetical protein LTR16_011981, partial [Cryomyces antarcticus]